MKKIVLFGSTNYMGQMLEMRDVLTRMGHLVRLPAFDRFPNMSAYDVCDYNRSLVDWCDVAFFWWDQRSPGAIFDFGMVFMSRKPIKIIYLEKKVFKDVFLEYEEKSMKEAANDIDFEEVMKLYSKALESRKGLFVDKKV